MELIESVIERIKEYISLDTDECIEYPITNADGYGVMQSYLNDKKKHFLMHRVSYQLFYKEDLSSSDIICHTCDNRCCINPKHLFKGTHADNVKDCIKKGRNARGEENGRYIDGRTKYKIKKEHHHNRRLTLEQVREIRKLREEGKTLQEVSNLTDISISSVKDVSSGRTYKTFI